MWESIKNNDLLKQEFDFLDTLPLIDKIDLYSSVNDNMYYIVNKYNDQYINYVENNGLFPDDCIFGAISVRGFAEYICHRYHLKYFSETVYFWSEE